MARVLADAEVEEIKELLIPIARMDWPIDAYTYAGLKKILRECSGKADEALKILEVTGK